MHTVKPGTLLLAPFALFNINAHNTSDDIVRMLANHANLKKMAGKLN